MDISNTRLKELLDKYLDGTASAEEISEVDAWYASFASHKGVTEQLNADQQVALEQLLFSRIHREISQAEAPLRVLRPRARYWWAAASVAVLLAAGGVYYAVNRTTEQRVGGNMITATAEKGSIRKITLPDSSIIWLNADSKIRYAQQNGREIWLEGEGYFEIAPRQEEGFLVHTGQLDVQVLGTSFNIDAYAPADSITVTVSSGKVAVRTEKHADVAIAANQQAVYKATADRINKYDISAADFGAWREGLLVFKNASFESIARTLERRYKVHIRFDGQKTASALLSARFGKDEPIKDILRMLCDIYGFNYRQEPGSEEYLVYDAQPHH
ncbi:FecR family protein [Chitinophaga filiformis]|uniref:Ferric-dicitrate binding protein FerR, regulates iron transport through sigma-19 n=1 Tax=Chitinophaga filiformis TaxID=104663 RepID=A0A1G7SJL6_CHIFI|nr:FecR domain-containing protein [Chitinophaga filiformis]SDG23193.1 ferric-dicitrate binding protein FerR, regulates iron transport through sigma-19 [Chitinophaga filiformis]